MLVAPLRISAMSSSSNRARFLRRIEIVRRAVQAPLKQKGPRGRWNMGERLSTATPPANRAVARDSPG